MIVVDASAVIAALYRPGPARRQLETNGAHAPHLVDAEVAQTLRRHVLRRLIPQQQAEQCLLTWAAIGVRRWPVLPHLPRMWELRENLSAYDASYLALAEELEVPLVTLDARMARSPGLTCDVRVVPG